MEQMQATSEKDAASAADGMTRITDETIKDYTTKSIKEADQSVVNTSLSITPQETTIHSHDERLHGSCNSSPDNHQSSTQQPQERDILPHQPSTDLQHEHMFSSNSGSDEFGSGDPDLDQLCRISANRFGAPESPYDDLPLSFSLPYSGDGKGARMYSCNICSFKTIFKNSLVNHQAVHSDARPWICEICDYAAKRKQDLKKHLQTMHGMVVDSLALKPGHGMVVDSLALKPGANPPASSASSSGLASPVETKPLIVNNVVVSDDQRSSNMLGFGPHMAHSASVLAHQQAAAAAAQFGHPLPSSATMNQNARSMPMPAVGKFISDKFPFNQYFGDGGMPRFPGEAFMSPTHMGLRATAKDDKGASGLDSLPSHRFHSQGDRVGGQSAVHKFHSSDTGLHSEGRESRHYLPSVSEILSKDRLQPGSSSDQRTAVRSPEMGSRLPEIATGHSRDARPVDPNSPARVSSVSEGIGLGASHRWKRSSGDLSSEDGFQADQSMVPRKAARLQSSGSECDPSHHVSSQSDHVGSIEPISSTVSHARSLETRKSFHCLHCDIMFFDNALYLMHMGLHDNSNPWKCSVCGRTFFEKYSFTSHFINQH
ncbi:hypothetical protein V1264_002730 [Littorina saxatilis]|uniref:C2H2-type domain-containing protein n=2 Tax=Littorina saxatilis TaxID=31220 RepID=A0AAN9G8G1_9CAEN